ncbi:MAG: hypothetical protein IJO36_00960 [Clostridia bacterium]|nr:hypothetical protein [Clostridia bacterium]
MRNSKLWLITEFKSERCLPFKRGGLLAVEGFFSFRAIIQNSLSPTDSSLLREPEQSASASLKAGFRFCLPCRGGAELSEAEGFQKEVYV